MSHDNPMIIRFVGDEMTLKTTLLLCDLIVTINALVSCITGLEERLRPMITLTATCVVFSTNTKLWCHTNSLPMKHVDAPESRSAWVCVIVDLPPLIVMGNKKQSVGSKEKVRLFWMHDASRVSLMVPTKNWHPCFPSLLVLG